MSEICYGNMKEIHYDDDTELKCPCCGQGTYSLKKYSIVLPKFYLIWIGIDMYTIIACPVCMRKAIADLRKRYILKSNILYLITSLVLDAYEHKSKSRGHSKDIFNDKPASSIFSK